MVIFHFLHTSFKKKKSSIKGLLDNFCKKRAGVILWMQSEIPLSNQSIADSHSFPLENFYSTTAEPFLSDVFFQALYSLSFMPQ